MHYSSFTLILENKEIYLWICDTMDIHVEREEVILSQSLVFLFDRLVQGLARANQL